MHLPIFYATHISFEQNLNLFLVSVKFQVSDGNSLSNQNGNTNMIQCFNYVFPLAKSQAT